ncbi:MAG UNVERIFIED_CONTAM: hypothetical protein LVR18_05345 [Planctomycetaceae bacterium]
MDVNPPLTVRAQNGQPGVAYIGATSADSGADSAESGCSVFSVFSGEFWITMVTFVRPSALSAAAGVSFAAVVVVSLFAVSPRRCS